MKANKINIGDLGTKGTQSGVTQYSKSMAPKDGNCLLSQNKYKTS